MLGSKILTSKIPIIIPVSLAFIYPPITIIIAFVAIAVVIAIANCYSYHCLRHHCLRRRCQPRWKFGRGFVIDGNFTCNHQQQKQAADDVWIKKGESFMTEQTRYKKHLNVALEITEASLCSYFLYPLHCSPILA